MFNTMSLLAYADAAPTTGAGPADFLSSLSSLSPIFSLGLGGVLAGMLIKRIGIMPVGEYKDAKEAWDKERAETKESCDRERLDTKLASDTHIAKLEEDLDEARVTNSELTNTIINQVVPAVTRVAGPLNRLVELEQKQPKRRGQVDD